MFKTMLSKINILQVFLQLSGKNSTYKDRKTEKCKKTEKIEISLVIIIFLSYNGTDLIIITQVFGGIKLE